MRRSKHTLSHYRMHTCDMGELIPIQCVPVLAGDTMQGSSSAMIRVSPLNTPVMHPVTVRIHHWFVPNRLLWKEDENGGWEQFITGGPDGNNSATIPQRVYATGKKNLGNYLGIPALGTGRALNDLPLRATNFIFNQRYRDQDLVTERSLSNQTIPRIAWEKDDLTSARPWTQKGPQVTLPLGTAAPIFTDQSGGDNFISVKDDAGVNRLVENPSGTQVKTAIGTASPGQELFADLSAAGAIDVNDFREAFAKQRYQEARARYGSRFTEYLRYLGIRPSDARLQEPEYVGGGTARLSFSEVLQTSGTTDGSGDGVGDLYGHGIAGVRTPSFRKFFEEHGYLVSLLSVRPKAVYMNGVDREFLKLTKEEYFQKELANLGQQAVLAGQLFTDQAGYRDDWAFQDRYQEYRKHPSLVGQDFRDTLNAWHLARELTSGVALNQSFVECNPSKRIFQVTSGDSLWIMINNSLVARRMVPKTASPRIL
ncbi:MAG: major capsid protein [Microviridae sp.]|nr:MAG: major capsid protein [Microviridae sp.]